MNRPKIGRILAGAVGLGFIGTAILHSTGYSYIVQLTEAAPTELKALAPALWLSFFFDFTVLVLIVAVPLVVVAAEVL